MGERRATGGEQRAAGAAAPDLAAPAEPGPAPATQPAGSLGRVRVRFGKQGDLRWTSHRDLLRLFERLFRRAGLQLAMSGGYHPKPKLHFPSALALGVAAADEVVELELAETVAADALHARLRQLAPAGLEIVDVRPLPPGVKGRPVRLTYELPVPAARQAQVQAAIERLEGRPSWLVQRPDRPQPIDVRTGLERLELVDGRLRLVLRGDLPSPVKPRDVLELLGESSLLDETDHWLTRTAVELAP